MGEAGDQKSNKRMVKQVRTRAKLSSFLTGTKWKKLREIEEGGGGGGGEELCSKSAKKQAGGKGRSTQGKEELNEAEGKRGSKKGNFLKTKKLKHQITCGGIPSKNEGKRPNRQSARYWKR